MATYNIKAPDGYTYSVEGPEGADQNDLFAFVQQQMEQRALHRELINQTGLMTTMGRGIARGAGELMSTATDVIPAMAGSALGFTDYAKEQMGEYAQKKEAREAKYPTLFPSYKDVQGIGDFPKFALETISEQAANLATSLIPAVGIGSLAGRSALTTVGKSLAAQAAERGLAKEAAEEFIATGMKAAAQSPEVIQAVSRATARGQALGSYLGSYAQNAPEIFGNIYEHNNNQLAPGAALIFGSAAAALDAILPMKLAMRMNPVMKVGIVEKVLEKSGMQKGLIRSIASNTLADLGIEGLTESAQEAISIAAERFVSEHPKVFGSKEWDRIIESGIRGAVAGGGFGAVGGTREGFKARAERIQEQKEAQQAAQLRQQVSESDAQILAEQQQWEQARAAQPQMEFPGMEQPGPYTSVAPKFTPDVGEDVNEAQRVMFTETGELTPQMEKLAGKFQKAREKQAAVAKKQAEQKAAAAQKQADAQAKAETALRKRFLSAKQMEFPGFDLGTVEGTRAREQEQARAAQESGQGDLFAAPTPAPTATPAPVETPAPTGPIPVSSANATLDNFTVIDDPQAFRKLLAGKVIGPTATIFSPKGPLAGKDLSNPEDVATIRSVLTAYAEKRPNTATIIENFLNKRPEFALIKPTPEGAEDAARANVGAGGAGIRPFVGEGNTEQLVEGAKAPVTGGVVPSETPIEQPTGGEAPSSVAVEQPPTPTEPPAAPTETTVTPTEPPAAPTETTVTPTEAPTTAAPVTPKFIQNIDNETNALIDTQLRDTGNLNKKQTFELKDLIGGPRIDEIRSLLRLPRLATEHTNIKQANPTDSRLETIRSSVEQSSPELVPVFDNLVNAPNAQQGQMLEQLNHFAVQQLNDEIRTHLPAVKAATTEETKSTAETLKPHEVLTEGEERVIDAFTNDWVNENVARTNLRNVVAATVTDEQLKTLEAHYGIGQEEGSFWGKLRDDVTRYTNKGAKAVAKAIRNIIKTIAEGVLAIGVVFNPAAYSTHFDFKTPPANVRTIQVGEREIRAMVPTNAAAKMSDTARDVYESMAPTAMQSGKGFIIADKPMGMIHVFRADGSLLVQDAALYGKDRGDVLGKSSLSGGPRVTPSGKFTLEAVKDSEYTGGMVFQLPETKDETGYVAVHAVYVGNPKENRVKRLASTNLEDRRISYGCINTTNDTFLNALVPATEELNGGILMVLPDNPARLSEFAAKTEPVMQTLTDTQQQAYTGEAQGAFGDNRRKVQTETPTGDKPQSIWLSKKENQQLNDAAATYGEKSAQERGDKLFLPNYVGPKFNDEQRALAERGDLSNLLRNLLDTTITDPAIKQVIRRIISLNLKTRIEIGDPTGGMALNSPAFQNWFGNSKVVDANGNPLVVYHGTTQNFSAFNAGRLGENTKHPTSQLGFFFSASPEVANLFTQTVDTGAWPVKVTQKAGANTMPVYLSIKNPYVMTVNDFKGVTGQQLKAFKERLIANGYDGIQIKGEPRFAEQFGGGEYAADTWVAFRPNDVKSAIGNRGTYDQNNPDIRYAEGKAGSYDPATNTITLDPTRGLNAHTFIHESLHAAISHVLANPNHPLTKEFTKFFTSIQDRLGSAYGATNLQEFAAELVGNPSFQAVLKSIKTPRSESLFRTIIRKIAEFFGFKPGTTAFETGVKFINDALDITGDVQPTGAQKLFLGTGDFTYPSEVSKLVPPLAGQAIERAKNALSNLTGRDIQKTLFGFFGLNHLNTIYGRDIPSFQMLLDAVEQRQGTQEQTEKEIAKKVREFTAVNNQYPDQVAKMGLFASKARRAEVDVLSPFKPTQVAPEKWAKMKAADKAKFVEAEGKRTQAYLAFKNEFSQFAKPVQDMYRTMRNDFDAQFKQFITEFEKAAEAGGLSKKFINDYITKYPLVGYIPFKRYGDFWVEYTDPESNERVASSFESIRERQMFIDQMLKGVEYRAYQRIQDATYTGQGVPQGSFVYKIMSALRESGASAEHLNSVYQAYLEAFPASSLMKQFMESKNVRGEDTDIIRNYNNLMTQYARKLSQLKYTPQIDRALSQIAQEGNASRNETVTAVAQHVIDGASFIHNPTYSNAVRTMASASYFMNMAGNISTGVLNLVSIMSTFNSMLNSRYVRGVAHSGFGVMESTAAVNSALKTVMKGGFKRDAKATLNGEYFDAWGNDPRYKALYREMMNHGQLEHTMARDVLEGRNQKTTPYSGRYARFMQALAVPLNASEKYVRSVTAVAAYDLEYERTKSQEKAIQYALEVVKEVNTGGMAAVSPRMFQSGFGRIFFTFKNFIWNQAAVIARAWHQAFANADPAMRAGARRYLLWTYGTAGAFLGLKGLPFYGAASVLATMINALVGDDDEPFDFDNFVRSNTSELFFKGLGNWAFNLEMANRAGIASDLIFRDDPRGVATNGYVQTAMMQAFGPVGGAILNTGRAVKMFNDGEIERAIETASPAFIRNMMKGVRYMTEGATTLKGEPIMEDISAYNSIMQMFGFSPADLSTRYELLQEGKGFEREINDRRKNIVRLYLMGVTTGDSDLVNEALEKGTKFSAAHPEKAITGDTYSRAVKQWEVAKQESIYGVRFDKKLLPQIREKFFSEE